MFAYTVCGALAGLAGVVLAARTTTGQPNAGIAYELDAIAVGGQGHYWFNDHVRLGLTGNTNEEGDADSNLGAADDNHTRS